MKPGMTNEFERVRRIVRRDEMPGIATRSFSFALVRDHLQALVMLCRARIACNIGTDAHDARLPDGYSLASTGSPLTGTKMQVMASARSVNDGSPDQCQRRTGRSGSAMLYLAASRALSRISDGCLGRKRQTRPIGPVARNRWVHCCSACSPRCAPL